MARPRATSARRAAPNPRQANLHRNPSPPTSPPTNSSSRSPNPTPEHPNPGQPPRRAGDGTSHCRHRPAELERAAAGACAPMPALDHHRQQPRRTGHARPRSLRPRDYHRHAGRRPRSRSERRTRTRGQPRRRRTRRHRRRRRPTRSTERNAQSHAAAPHDRRGNRARRRARCRQRAELSTTRSSRPPSRLGARATDLTPGRPQS